MIDKLLVKLKRNVYNQSILKSEVGLVRIAVCDDKSFFREKLSTIANEFFGNSEAVKIERFSTGKDLVKAHSESRFNIIFLDIEMPELSGMDAGKAIRCIDKTVLIIFVTSHADYVWQSLKIEAFDFIRKPYEDAEVYDVLRRAVNKSRDQLIEIEIKYKDTVNVLNIGDIVFIEIQKRHLKFITTSNEFTCIGKLDYYDHLLSPYGFSRCHKSYLVNMGFIESVSDKDVIEMYLGKHVQIATRAKKDFLRAYNDFRARYRI